MTKQHFNAIAAIIRQHQVDTKGKFEQQVGGEDVARRLADYFATINPRFDRQRFLVASGVDRA